MKLGNLLTAMVTPFREDGSFNGGAAADLAEHLIETGNEGVVVAGTTGESPTLTDEEKLDLFRVVVERLGGRATVVAGTGTYDTRHSIELTTEAEKLGVDAIMAVVPYYNRPPQDSLYKHFRAIAESTSLPVMLYNVPGRTATNLLPETVARLAKIDNIIAIKEASGDMEQVAEIRRVTPPDFDIYSGDDGQTLPILSLGGTGVVSVSGHVVGRRLRTMIESFQKGDVRTATEIHLELLPIFQAMFVTTNPVPVKTAVRMLGLDVGPLRPPLHEPSEQQRKAIQTALDECGLLD